MAIFAGFGVVFAGLFRDRLLPAPRVEVAAVVALEDAPAAASLPSSASVPPAPAEASAPLFQASGWIEPAPYSVKVPALIDGVVAEVMVLEGENVEPGQVLARLVADDAKLALAAAEARHRHLESSRQAQVAAWEAAQKRSAASQAEVTAARTLETEAGQQRERLDRLSRSGAVPELDAITARLRVEREQSLHQAAQARDGEHAAEVRRMESEVVAKADEIAVAAVAVSQARLALERTEIRSPLKGRVLRLMAAPGDKKMLGMDHPDSSTICVLYDPHRLRVRVDVPLADAAQLRPGQRVMIHTNLLAARTFEGEVTGIAGEADLQRNTLQAKVRITDPDDQLRPEMLCRVEFYGGASRSSPNPRVSPEAEVSEVSRLSLWVPAQALRGNEVWVCDPESRRLARRTIHLLPDTRDAYRRIRDGLRPGEQVVLTAGDWRDGQRVRPALVQP